jgi:predicted nucleotidyltransferase
MLDEIILKTLKYFDVQDHALTLLELRKYLLKIEGKSSASYSVGQVLETLETSLKNSVIQKHGFYFLKGRESLVEKRLHNNFYASPRLKRAHKYLPGIRYIPFVSAVALTGSEALNNSKKGSDIDILVFVKSGRMWLARLCLSAYFQILGMRRHGQYVENRFCLNHYIQELKVLSDDRNLYTAVEYVSLIPFFGAEKIYEFQLLNLPWIKKFLLQPEIVSYKTAKASSFKVGLEKLFSGQVGNWLEKVVGLAQKNRIKIQEYILVETDELSFHPASKGQQVLKKYRQS